MTFLQRASVLALAVLLLAGCAGAGCWSACRESQSRATCTAWCTPPR